jgi:hypothetical protein
MTASITSIAPPANRIDRDLFDAQDAIGHAADLAALAGEGAYAFARLSITCGSSAAVDAVAAALGVTARWSSAACYTAEAMRGAAAVEVTFYGTRPVAAA